MSDTAVESVAVLSAEDVALMMRSIRDARSRIAEEVATAEALHRRLEREVEMISEHLIDVTKADNERIAYLEAQLTAHLLNKRAADPECKSISTPWGRIESREQEPEFIRDEAVLLAWADEQELLGVDGYVRTTVKREADWKAIKAASRLGLEHIVIDGEIVPGVTVVERPLKVSVKVID